MNTLLKSIVPEPYQLLARIAFYALVVAALVGFGFFKGLAIGNAKLHDAQVKASLEGARIVVARGEVTRIVETKYVTQLAKQAVITETITNEIHHYANPSDPPVAGSFRLYTDAAAAGSIPDRTRLADAAAVPLEDATATVAENYGECRTIAIRLTGLQEWVTRQGSVK